MELRFYIERFAREFASWAGAVRRPEVDGYRPSVFAQEFPTPDAAHLSNWLIDAAALGAILLIFLKIVDHFKRRPSLEQELEKLLKQIRTELNQLRHEQSNHLSEVRGRVEGAHQRVDLLTHDLNNKLQRLAELRAAAQRERRVGLAGGEQRVELADDGQQRFSPREVVRHIARATFDAGVVGEKFKKRIDARKGAGGGARFLFQCVGDAGDGGGLDGINWINWIDEGDLI